MKKYFIYTIILLTLLNITRYVNAESLVVVTKQERGDEVNFYVENRQFSEITLTFDVTLYNMKANVPIPYSTVYAGNRKVKAFTIKRIDKRKRWRYTYNSSWKWGTLRAAHSRHAVYRLPYEKGRTFKVLQGFNGRFSHFGDQKYAIDWRMPEGTKITAAREGIVVACDGSYSTGGPNKKYLSRVNYVYIKHSDGTFGEYLHFQKNGVRVRPGQKIKAGEVVGLSGNTGYSTEPHLHFMVFKTLSGKKRQSFSIQFLINRKLVTLKEGRWYRATRYGF